MKKGFRVIALFLMCQLMLCGCGTSLYDLTEEEEEVVIHYAAYVLAKHNVYQKDGMVDINPELYETESGEDDTQTLEAEEPDTEAADQTEQADAQTESSGTAGQSSEEPDDTISLAEAVGYKGKLEVSYTGFSIMDNFKEGNAYSVEPHSGYAFVAAQFTMENISDETIDVDVMSSSPTFRMSYGDSRWIKEDVTLLLTDLSTYTGSLAGGESVDLVLLFEVPAEDAPSIEKVAFSVQKDGETYQIAQ